jgi:hypothetical protein
MTSSPDYYAFRHGAEVPRLSYTELQRAFASIFGELEEQGWFQAKLGKDCADNRKDIGAVVLGKLGRDLWPFSSAVGREPEQWLFTLVEFAYHHISKPLESYYHNWDNCGVHVTRSDEAAGRTDFSERANILLRRYEKPFELRPDGEIWEVAPTGLEAIEPTQTGEPSIDDRVQAAVRQFRHYGATEDDRRHAVRDLADVLEYLRKSVGTQLPTSDESDLFNIANSFGIRHHNPQQKTDYDTGIWLEWIFYSYLNAIATVTKILART